jgi:hypothetical protein
LSVAAQNLVVNPSFEDLTACPNDLSQIELAIGWRGLWRSADLFNACADDTVSVPFNALGDQMPLDGEGYAGLSIYSQAYKEYIEGELSIPLVPGVLTHVSMYVAPGGFGIPSWASPVFAASHVGLRLSTAPLWPMQDGALEFNEAVLFMTEVLSDTSDWTVLSTTFYPDSAYAYLQIGSFFEDGFINSLVLDATGDFQAAYAFVDMVCVAQQSGVCEEAVGVSPIGSPTAQRGGILFEEILRLPVDEWGMAGSLTEVLLHDQLGRVVWSERREGVAGPVIWSLPLLAEGHYIIELRFRDRPSVVIRSLKL